MEPDEKVKSAKIRAVNRVNTYLLLCKKVSKYGKVKIEKVRAESLIPLKAFNSFISRMEVRDRVKICDIEIEFQEGMHIIDLLDLMWPEEKDDSQKKKRKRQNKKPMVICPMRAKNMQ